MHSTGQPAFEEEWRRKILTDFFHNSAWTLEMQNIFVFFLKSAAAGLLDNDQIKAIGALCIKVYGALTDKQDILGFSKCKFQAFFGVNVRYFWVQI